MPCITDVMIEFNFLFRIYVMQNKLDTGPWPHYGGTAAVFNTFHCINKSQYRLSLCIPQNYEIKNRGNATLGRPGPSCSNFGKDATRIFRNFYY